MNYLELNKIQTSRMKQITSNSYVMEWNDNDFMDYLLGDLPEMRYDHSDDIIANEVKRLEKLLLEYNAFFTDKKRFLNDVKTIISRIQEKTPSWYGCSIYEIEMYLKMHCSCLISGEGGVGKSYFIKCFEEELEKKGIKHLCIYGKFEKDVSRIDVDEILSNCDDGFVFICDAINEMTEDGQEGLLGLLRILKQNPKMRIILSYRSNSMDEVILNSFKDIVDYQYKFPGVSFESALYEILKLSVPDVYLYEDILYSNNALLLSMLCDVLSSEKIRNEEENGVASITYILEHYIKTTIGKLFKNNITCRGVDIWKDTKRVADWMYRNEKKNIDEESLLSAIKTGDNFLPSMMQMGFLDVIEHNNNKYYYFVIDRLTDFLLARSLFEDISDKEYAEKINIIKNKISSIRGIEEAIIIAIFDNYSPDYVGINKILEDTGLIRRLECSTIVKMHFLSANINDFQRVFMPLEHDGLLMSMGGFTDKPFNCTNYLFKYYCSDNKRMADLSKVLSEAFFLGGIINRLKNLLYFTTLNDRFDRRDDEAFYFAVLCCAAPVIDVRYLAIKLLYEVVSKNYDYVDRLIGEYENIKDYYIQESFIYVLSQTKKNEGTSAFFNKIIKSQENLTAKSIRRISTYFGEPYSYISWERKDLYKFNKNAIISDSLNDILFYIDMMDKDFLPFRYWGRDHIDMYTRFLVNDKLEIKKINDYLSKKYSCVCNGDCNGLLSFENKIMPEIQGITEPETIDMNSFLECFDYVLKHIFSLYNVLPNDDAANMREREYQNSVYKKCVDIAVGIYYGSLMCNHYTNQFATYNNNQNSIGYEVYDPLEYGEKVVLTSPIPTYQELIERLGDYVINSIEQPSKKGVDWVKDVQLTRRNILHILEPFKVRKQEWVLLAGRVSLHEDNMHDTRWIDSYDVWCCSSDNETITNDGNARYLTIELEEYLGDLKTYPDNDLKPWLCKRINNIVSNSDVFEETSLVLPPSEIIKYFNLKINIADLSWVTENNEKVIVCNNNRNSYYRDPIGGTVFIRRDYFDIFAQNHDIKYFVYTERYIPEAGYADETSLHFEIVRNQIKKEIPNNVNYKYNLENNPLCDKCPYFLEEKKSDESSGIDVNDYLDDILKKYGGA